MFFHYSDYSNIQTISTDLDQDVLIRKSFYVKGSPISKALTCMKIYLYKQKQKKLARRPILQAILLYEQFIHLTQINLHLNIQVLSTQKHAYQSFCFLVTSWFDSICVTVTCCVNFREKHLNEYELQLFDYNV